LAAFIIGTFTNTNNDKLLHNLRPRSANIFFLSDFFLNTYFIDDTNKTAVSSFYNLPVKRLLPDIAPWRLLLSERLRIRIMNNFCIICDHLLPIYFFFVGLFPEYFIDDTNKTAVSSFYNLPVKRLLPDIAPWRLLLSVRV
jgi:hypothetical protein